LLTQKNAHILHKKVKWGKKMKSFSLILKWNVNMKQVFYEQMSYWWIYVWLVGNGEFPKKRETYQWDWLLLNLYVIDKKTVSWYYVELPDALCANE
jgi:hypothetical protein